MLRFLTSLLALLWLTSADAAGPPYPGYGASVVPVVLPSAVVGNTAITLTMPAVASWWNVIVDIKCGNNGATTAAYVQATLAGVFGGTETFIVSVPSSSTAGQGEVDVAAGGLGNGGNGLIAADVNTAITFTLPALGTGNTAATCTLYGYRVPYQ